MSDNGDEVMAYALKHFGYHFVERKARKSETLWQSGRETWTFDQFTQILQDAVARAPEGSDVTVDLDGGGYDDEPPSLSIIYTIMETDDEHRARVQHTLNEAAQRIAREEQHQFSVYQSLKKKFEG